MGGIMNNTIDQEVLIIGAGSSGICMGIQLKNAGIEDFMILDKAGGVGGTWYHNTYPGAECDVQSHLYSFSFEPKLDWSRPFGGQAEILEYLNFCTDKYGIREHIKFNTEVASITWNDSNEVWTTVTKSGESICSRIVVSALGMFNNIVWPKIKGRELFSGEHFHSARWNHDIDLHGKKVGVIGIAASAIQFVPEIVDRVSELHLFQRTANWVVPKNNTPYTEQELLAFREEPSLVETSRDETYRLWNTLATFTEKEILSKIEKSGLARIAEVADPKTREALTPQHPFGCKRPLFSDVYYPVFNKDHVHLNTDDIDSIASNGVITSDGLLTEVDVLIYSTGFETTTYLSAIDVKGKNGLDIHDAWSDGPQAYLGISTHGFPNLFMLYGPNTNQGCILVMIEEQVKYIIRRLKTMRSEGILASDIKKDVMRKFNDKLQDDIKGIDVWQHACGNDFYYRAGPSGRFVTQWPKSMDDFAKETDRLEDNFYE
jgi:cation diffusion facilitator CzcD-associated flavoprotein CzcO